MASLAFHTAEGKSLVNSLIGSLNVILGVDMRDLEHEALVEIGNIIISSCMSAMANLLGEEISFAVPVFHEANPKQLLNLCQDKAPGGENEEAALIIARCNGECSTFFYVN